MNADTKPLAAADAPLPPDLERIRTSARRVKELDDERAAEKERRDRLMAEAKDAGHSYRTIAAAAHAGDGCATVSVVQNAVKDYG
jgi:hypothetical protein